ncbi:GTP-binding protein EngB [Candidatus Thorarchaeota archaeon]|nr:MAG: GTP-binding protein EngB [Candidatus Thorarchaeota archaeon]
MHEHVHSGGISLKKPLIVFAGRSNVGKSSTIRALTGRKVRVGKRPGSTRWEIMIDLGSVTAVDIPGFGYMASTSKTEIEEMKKLLVQKLEEWSEDIIVAVLIIDVSLFRELVNRWEARGEIPIDIEFYTFLIEIAENVIVLANKFDKLKKKQKLTELEFLKEKLSTAAPNHELKIIPTSASKKIGMSELKEAIEHILSSSRIVPPNW